MQSAFVIAFERCAHRSPARMSQGAPLSLCRAPPNSVLESGTVHLRWVLMLGCSGNTVPLRKAPGLWEELHVHIQTEMHLRCLSHTILHQLAGT